MAKTSLSKDKIRFLLLEGVHQSAIETLNKAGYYNIEYLTDALEENELIERIQDAFFLGIRSRTNVTEKVLKSANKLIGIGCFCIGTNQVDLDIATKYGIPVFNAPFSNTRSVAELVIAEAILLKRGVPEKNANMHRGVWCKSAKNSNEIRGKKMGIIGYGNIGSQVSIMAESLGMKVLFYDIATKLPMGNATQVSSLDVLLSECDIVTLHVPETELTKNMISKSQLNKMKKDSVLINAARGTIVDIDALVDSLGSKHLQGAAIDVNPYEPQSNDEEFLSPLRSFDNVLLTPHIGGSTIEAQRNIGDEVAEKLVKYSDNGDTVFSVNFPEVSLPSYPNVHRLLHIHENKPGILSQINQIFSENHINISAQHLRTNEKIGYVVIDVDAEYSALALEKLRKINGTIKSRVLF